MPMTSRMRWAKRAQHPLLVSSLLLLAPLSSAAADWTLDRSAERALAVAPELDAARANATVEPVWPTKPVAGPTPP